MKKCPICKKTLSLKDIYDEDDCGIDFVRIKTYYVGTEETCECGYKNFLDFIHKGGIKCGKAS